MTPEEKFEQMILERLIRPSMQKEKVFGIIEALGLNPEKLIRLILKLYMEQGHKREEICNMLMHILIDHTDPKNVKMEKIDVIQH